MSGGRCGRAVARTLASSTSWTSGRVISGRAEVTRAEPGQAFELRMTDADADWVNSTVSFDLTPSAIGTNVRFAHRGWPEANAHYRISCHCWAMYLRILRRHIEYGESVPYDERLPV